MDPCRTPVLREREDEKSEPQRTSWARSLRNEDINLQAEDEKLNWEASLRKSSESD